MTPTAISALVGVGVVLVGLVLSLPWFNKPTMPKRVLISMTILLFSGSGVLAGSVAAHAITGA